MEELARRSRTDGEPDERLFALVGEGNSTAFETLYRQTERAVYALALSILKNPDDAQDVAQETYLKVRAAAHLYVPQGKP
ncbi:MAG: RNA polymerase sigma factor, partial [Clostridia bacterium]|nr:RNA polymerase sigma factor [Clostridia bacterium]